MRKLQSALVLSALLVCVGAFAAVDDQAADKALRREALRLNEITGDSMIENQIKQLKEKPEHAKKLLAAAAALAKEQEKDPPFNFNAAFVLGTLAREHKDLEKGKLFFRLVIDQGVKLKSDQKVVIGYDDLIDLYIENKKYDEAEKACKELLEKRGGQELQTAKIMVLLRLAQVNALQGKSEEAFKIMAPFIEKAGDDPEIMRIHGWLLRHTGKYEDAVKIYEKLIDKVQRDEVKDRIRYMLSNLYSEAGDVDKAASHLQELLKKKPDDAAYNNDLGYIWADHDKNLPEAEKMIRKALDLEPKNAAYLDSMGWVLFKLKKYEEAKKYLLDAAADPEGQHAEILDHLGDVHHSLKEKAEAVSAWKKALEVSGTSQRDAKRKAEIEKKLKENQ